MAASDSPAPKGTGFRRVLVALDSSAASGATLEIAAGLAAASACELRGLFVEDQDLLRLAEMPFAQEIQLARAISRTLAPEQLLRDLRAQAEVIRTAMARQALQHRLAWSFQVTRGRSEEAILLAAMAGDIIAMARGFGPLSQVGRFSRRVRLIAARAPGPLLLAGEAPSRRPGSVLLPYDASPTADRMLWMGLELARAQRNVLEIMLLGEAAEHGDAMAARLRGAAAGERLPDLRIWTPRDRGVALRRLREADRGLLLLPADAPWFRLGEVDEILERARLPVIVQAEGPAEDI
jgi:nucleotide-binding universal stress UspA family protein